MDSYVQIRFKERPAEMKDLEAVVIMLNETFRHLLGVEAMFTPEGFGADWSLPGFNLESDTRLVVTPEGEIAGYIEVWDLLNPSVRVNFWGQTHPRFTGMGVGAQLVEFAERRAARAVARAPQEARVVLQSYVPSINPQVGPLLEQHGFKLIRHALRMVIELNGTPPKVELPEGIQIRSFKRGKDEVQTVQAVRESFKDHFGYVDTPFEDEFQRWQHRMETDPEFDPELWFLALHGDQVVGTSLCRYKVEDDPEMSWVGTLGVTRPWRRHGVGLALLQHSFAEFYKRGRRKVGLGVDALSLTGATRLYIKAGMHSDPARQFDLFEKELRTGVDLTTHSLE
jgi:mycothiol synthase